MRWLRGRQGMLAIPLLVLAIALAVVGTFQYRWLGRVSEAERQRMRGSLTAAAQQLADEISQELHRLFRAFLAPEHEDLAPLVHAWRRQSPYPELVEAVYAADRDGDAWTLRRFDERTDALVGAAWPAALAPLRPHLDTLDERGPGERFPGPLFGTIPALLIVQLPARREPEFIFSRPHRVLLVQLDRAALATFIRNRAGRIFSVAGADGADVALTSDGTTLFRSSDSWPDGTRAADVSLDFRPVAPRGNRPPPPPGLRERPPSSAETWRLSVRQGAGGIDAAVAAAHRRNLAVALLVLLLLAAAGGLLINLVRRGERLRLQQARFVASMSHELNTPLAVLRVASENLHDGIVHDPEKVSRYVRTIARETAHLSEMVNHVLELAGMNAGVPVVARDAVDLRSVIDDAVAQSQWIFESAGVDIEVDVDDDLPPVRGNAQALTRAVQNLVANAIRHGGSGKWVGVRARHDRGTVTIEVADRGPGIDPADAGQIFEPFYRGRGSTTIRGTGLGLTIVKQIVTEHGGSVAVERPRGGGCAFVVRLPAGAEHD
ncbi:MAG TPA: HAMP domain-containing sensor histidine kinase [Thermoanaerobaculia bacterium]|nr:HAMP domain-containing sensor histidine kinase [Thermoanaerobaculia bacterium]